MTRYTAAVIQLDSQDDKKRNLEAIVRFVREAAEHGAKLIAMPENANYAGRDMKAEAEAVPGGETFNILSELALEYKAWIHGGSIYEINETAGDERPYNSTMLIGPDGRLAAKYHKIHPFDVKLANGGPSIMESDRVCPGDKIVTVETGELGTLGLSICYDIRFGEIFRLMALKGAEIFLTPANFTLNTGKDHWETILRARAIENGCYVIAPGQTGKKLKYQAYGNSMIIDPWGTVIARAGERPGIIYGEIDLDHLKKVRSQVLTLENRREDIYSLVER
ncbi:MAG: carbon-nitrogen hydrolase family protein [Eubacteriales bacterium]|nr:carbon-nitrogen hydrolase family protein [Eubacteriales bacterium]